MPNRVTAGCHNFCEHDTQETRRQQGLDLRAVIASSDLAILLKNTSTLCLGWQTPGSLEGPTRFSS